MNLDAKMAGNRKKKKREICPIYISLNQETEFDHSLIREAASSLNLSSWLLRTYIHSSLILIDN